MRWHYQDQKEPPSKLFKLVTSETFDLEKEIKQILKEQVKIDSNLPEIHERYYEKDIGKDFFLFLAKFKILFIINIYLIRARIENI